MDIAGRNMEVDRLDHVHIAVWDIEKAGRLFEGLIGARFKEFGPDPQSGVRSLVSAAGITLAAPLGPDAPLAQYLKRRGEGLHSIAFRVADLERAILDFEKHGVRMVNRLGLGQHRGAQFHPGDTCGAMIELEQY